MPRRLAVPGEVPDNPHLHLDDIVTPAVVQRLADGRSIVPVWRNEIGGVTFAIGDGAEYVKVGPPHREFVPAAEVERLAWLAGHVRVPEVLGYDSEPDGTLWLHTSGLPGISAVLDPWLTRPATVVPELGRALRAFHDQVPVSTCPWSWSVAERQVLKRSDLRELGDAPPEDLVVCHGDACNPNFILGADGACLGYVDLGLCGVADRWADLAPALMSLGWNYGPGWEPAFLAGYGIDLDADKLTYYTRLWEAE